jgi:predicted nucleotidyltransferase
VTAGTEVDRLLEQTTAWARRRPDVDAVALVGSWARGDPRPDSDVDLVLLTNTPETYAEREDWIADLGANAVVTTRSWGAITERRLLLPSGLEVEVGVGLPSWADTDPLDPGTKRVVVEGFRILHDPHGLLAALARACRD